MRYSMTLTFTEPILGTAPKNRDVYAAHIATKAEEMTGEQLEEELETVEELEEKGWTGFHVKPDGTRVLMDYMVKGFMKDACGMLRRCEGTRSSKVAAYKKKIDGLVFVFPRYPVLQLPAGGAFDVLERPLRAQTPQGERVALARSDIAPAGTKIEIEVQTLGEKAVPEKLLREWFDYGALRGLGQWRNASYGRFTYTMEPLQEN